MEPSTENTIVRLVPPKITSRSIQSELVCTRPMRHGGFNISVETSKGNRTLVHCYGHGGSGWTTLFGSVKEAIRLFNAQQVSKTTPIRVIGAGCMGLVSAIELARLGYQVNITAKDLYDIPSWKAAGYFAFVSLDTAPDQQPLLNAIGMETFLTYREIDKGNHPYLKQQLVRYIPVYCSRTTSSGLEDLETKGLIPQREKVTLDFGEGVRHEDFFRYMTYFVNGTLMMQDLWDEVHRLKIPVTVSEVTTFDEIHEACIFNCAGLGAKQLNSDDCLIPVRGHLVLLNELAGSSHLDYMIYTKVIQNGVEEFIYMFPKTLMVTDEQREGTACFATLGGTFITGFDQLNKKQQKEQDARELRKMLDRASLFFQGKRFEEV